MKRTIILSLTVLFLAFLLPASDPVALKVGKAVTVSGAQIENAIILIRDGKIEKLGSGITIPAGYTVKDYGKYTAYPGLINPMTSLGVSGIGSVSEWSDSREPGSYNPEISLYPAFYSWGNLLANTRDFGTVVALSAPSGGRISGKAALVVLDGWTPQDMYLRAEAALIVRLTDTSRRRRSSTSSTSSVNLSKEKRELKDFFTRSERYYRRAKQGLENPFNDKYEAMKVLWEKNFPVIISANGVDDIKFAIQLGQEFKLNLIISGVYDAENAIEEIKKSGYPVIVSSMYATNRRWEDGMDKVFRLPGKLEKAGIKFAFSAGGDATAFDLPIQAGRAVAYGLSAEGAVKALTMNPAEILGLKGYGVLAEGTVANIVISDGHILETSTRIKDIFINGKLVTGKSFFRKEFERARDRVSGEIK